MLEENHSGTGEKYLWVMWECRHVQHLGGETIAQDKVVAWNKIGAQDMDKIRYARWKDIKIYRCWCRVETEIRRVRNTEISKVYDF